MIIIGLENSKPCQVFKEKHSELKYIEVSNEEPKDLQEKNLRKRLDQLGVKQYPTILNPGMTRTVPLKMIDKEFAKKYNMK